MAFVEMTASPQVRRRSVSTWSWQVMHNVQFPRYVRAALGSWYSEDSWKEMATVEADLTTSGGPPLPGSVKEYESLFREACEGQSDEFEPLNKAIELRLDAYEKTCVKRSDYSNTFGANTLITLRL